ncbi:MAG TPA: glycine cleavage system aminomethyltransferase GcvT [Trueperaceae bacterium]
MKRTPLYDEHRGLGARMTEFAGWEMPVQYPSGINEEHLAVRQHAGIFDVSHMGQLRVRGREACEFLAYATLNDPGRLKPGRGQYSMLPNEKGGLIDDLYIYCEGDGNYLLVCNAANTARALAHLQGLTVGYEAEVVDESDEWALLALQGPGAALMLDRMVGADLTLLKKNRHTITMFRTVQVLVSRTGYTGEDGFEIFCPPAAAVPIWKKLLQAGAVPCGLGARDTLRLEAGFPLFGHEFNEDTNPLCSPYAWVVKDKAFYGRDAMWGADCGRCLVGLRLTAGRGIARPGYKILHQGQEVGEISSGTISPLTRDSIAMGWLDASLAEPGRAVEVQIRGQGMAATVVALPFYS